MSLLGHSKGVDLPALQEHLQGLWNRKELQELHQFLAASFSHMQEPLTGLLDLLEGCVTIQKVKSTSLSQFILTEFMRWKTNNPKAILKGLSEKEKLRLQQRALELLTDTQSGYMDPLLEVYQLSSLEKPLLLKHVTFLQDCCCCYKEALVFSVKVELQKDLDMEKMCVPLILLDKLPLVEMYVHGHPDLQQRLVSLLDSWCDPDFNIQQLLSHYPQLVLSKHQTDQIQPKLLSKHVFRLMEKFCIDPGLCSNSVYKRKLDSLRFLMYKTFGEKTMSEDNWRDHVQTMVAGNTELQIQLVQLLVKHCSLKTAAQWAAHYHVPRHRLPIGVWDIIQSLSPKQLEMCAVSVQPESWIPPQSYLQKYYQLPLAREDVHFVETLDELEQCRQAVLKPGCVVGLDMEWRASFGTVSAQFVALIQLAIQRQVFLLDLCAHSISHHNTTVNFIRALLSDNNILKLGYGMSGDSSSLVRTWPELREEPLKMEGVLDLLHVHQELACAEGRFILTAGQPYQTLRSHLGESRCLTLDCSEKARDQAVHVLRHFNVHFTPADIFSRCQACNCNEYFKLQREDMMRMMKERGLRQDIVPKQEDCELQEETQADYNSWRPPEGPEFSPHCRWAPQTTLNPQTFRFPSGAKVQLETVPPGLVPRIPVYFVCTGCGKVFWEGTHFDRVLSQFQEVLHVSDDVATIA